MRMTNPEVVLKFLQGRLGRPTLGDDTLLADALDSLAFLDLFLALESAGTHVLLDDVAACKTLGDLCRLLILPLDDRRDAATKLELGR
ncbi:UNVERIFIED_ORG: hypothetical protein BTE55_09815 [Rhizobium sophorae]